MTRERPVTLTASPSAGSSFTGWSESGCPGTGSCVVTMSAAKSVTATFTQNPPGTFALNVTRDRKRGRDQQSVRNRLRQRLL